MVSAVTHPLQIAALPEKARLGVVCVQQAGLLLTAGWHLVALEFIKAKERREMNQQHFLLIELMPSVVSNGLLCHIAQWALKSGSALSLEMDVQSNCQWNGLHLQIGTTFSEVPQDLESLILTTSEEIEQLTSFPVPKVRWTLNRQGEIMSALL